MTDRSSMDGRKLGAEIRVSVSDYGDRTASVARGEPVGQIGCGRLSARAVRTLERWPEPGDLFAFGRGHPSLTVSVLQVVYRVDEVPGVVVHCDSVDAHHILGCVRSPLGAHPTDPAAAVRDALKAWGFEIIDREP